MGKVIALFDTNIVIDVLNGYGAALEEAEKYSYREISDVTWIEVMTGAKPVEELAIRKFLTSFQRIPVTGEIVERAVVERRQRKVKLPDAIVIAIAVVGGRTLITRNTRDFPESDQHVRVPYRMPVQ